MKSSTLKGFASIVFILVVQFAFSFDSNSKRKVYDHMYEINIQWEHHKSDCPDELISFQSDIDRISYHLDRVIADLRANTPEGLSASALKNRIDLLNELQLYANTKVFPTNLYHKMRTPYFIDDFGVHCAVGYMIMKSGHSELSNRIRDEHNYDYLKDITTPGVLEWAAEHGFTFEELAWIQPGYMSQRSFTQVGGGTDSTVTVLCRHDWEDRLIFAGLFSEIDGSTPCDGIGYYKDGQMYCLGGGLEGKITDVYVYQNEVYVTGLFNYLGVDYSLAMHDGSQWNFINIPSREGMESVSGLADAPTFKQEVIIKNDQGLDEHEIWRQSYNGNWELQATVFGAMNGLALGPTQLAYGGIYDSLIMHLPGGDQNLVSKNACLRELSTDSWIPLSGTPPDTVLVVENVGTHFVWAGIGKFTDPGTPVNYMSSIHADTLAPLWGDIIVSGPSSNPDSLIIVRDIAMTGSISFASCGLFDTGFMYFGSGLQLGDMGLFHTNTGTGNPTMGSSDDMGVFGNGIEAVEVFDGKLFVGGYFQYLFDSVSNNFVMLDEPVIGTLDLDSDNLTVFPNPASECIHVRSSELIEQIILTDINGRPLREINSEEDIISVRDLPAGNYLLKFVMIDKRITHRKLIIQ